METVEVAAGILLRGNHVLACRRAAGGAHAGQWEFPGGKREGDETPRECLRRELREELGCEARVGRLVWSTCYRYPGGTPIELSFYFVEATDGPPRNRAFADIRWVRLGQLSRLDFLAADQPLVEMLDRGELDDVLEVAAPRRST
jgi:8-oxo-dGTP diphosphatase